MSTTSLSRAFTTRRARGSHDTVGSKLPQRSNTIAKHSGNIRDKISAPVNLVHTTNMLSYNAPDLPRQNRSNSTSSESKSDSGRSDHSPSSPATANSTPPTSPDMSPSEQCPEPNHLSSYFMAPGVMPTEKLAAKFDAPVIPKRSPSHTKKHSYEAIARSRSMSRLSGSERSESVNGSSTFSRSSSTSTAASVVSRSSSTRLQKLTAPPMPSSVSAPKAPPVSMPASHAAGMTSHPFGSELTQVTELVEEFKTKSQLATIDEDELYMESRGLRQWSPADYLSDIQSLSAVFFPEPLRRVAPAPLWI